MKLNIHFIKSAKQKKDWPTDSLVPEIALVGRSNAGKSSLLNCLAEQKEVAKVSRSPGKTRLINFFDVDSKFRFVDLPGYGFAKRSGSEMSEWKRMIETYLTERELLKAIILVKDVRRQWTNDEELIRQLAIRLDLEFLCVETKIDKLNQSERHFNRNSKIKTFYVSNATGEGVQKFAQYILNGRGFLSDI